MRTPLAILVALLLGGANVPAQDGVLLDLSIDAVYGVDAALVGDLNADGLPDVVVGDPEYTTCPSGEENDMQQGRVRFYSGADGSLLFDLPGTVCGGMLGQTLAPVGDWDGDGRDDVVATGDLPYDPHCRVRVLSGLDGSVLACLTQTSDFGTVSVARVRDVNGDGHDEVLVGNPTFLFQPDAPGGSVRLFAGATGKLLHFFQGDEPNQAFGTSVADAGDIDGDGTTDLVASAMNPGGYVRVFSGRTGAVLLDIPEPPAVPGTSVASFGRVVASAGDADADGTPDILVANTSDPSLADLGRVRVYSGATGELLIGVDAPVSGDFGAAVAGFGDLDLDGHDDFAVGSPFLGFDPTVPGRVSFFSGADGSLLGTIEDGVTWDLFGEVVRPAGDVDGDGLPDLLVAGNKRLQVLSGTILGGPTASLQTLTGAQPGEGFGAAVGGGVDLDADGFDDVLAGAPDADRGAGLVRGLSGSSGKPLFEHLGAVAGDGLGAAVAGVGDVDGDGVGDVLAGAPAEDGAGLDAGAALLLSGFTGNTLLTLQGTAAGGAFGSAVGGPGDVDGDGVPDLAVGAPGDGPPVGAGSVSLFSGQSGTLLFERKGTVADGRFGAALAAAGDVDGDGVPDLLVGAPGELPTGGVPKGRTHVLSGVDGSTVLVIAGDSVTTGAYGTSVSGGGDLDVDGIPDIVAGDPKAKDSVFATVSGKVRAHSGADGTALWNRKAANGQSGLGRAVAAGADVDGDGLPDVVAGTGKGPDSGKALALHGSDGKLITTLQGSLPGDRFGGALALTDVDGDGAFEIVVGASQGGDADAPPGEVSVFSLAPQFTPLGSGVGGLAGPPLLEGTGTMLAGEQAGFDLSAAPASAPGWLVLGKAFDSLPFAGGVLIPTLDLLVPFSTGADGTASWSATWSGAPPSGTAYFVQAWLVDPSAPAGLAGSNAVLAQVP